MRHNKHRNTLGLTSSHRAALLGNLASSLIMEGKVKTTLSKARAVRPFVEKVITLAKKGTLHHRRLAASRLRNPEAVKALFDDKVSEFQNRHGGYTRIYKLGPRASDGAEMAYIELIPGEDEGYSKSGRRSGNAKAVEAAPVAAAAPEAEVVEESDSVAEAPSEASAEETTKEDK